MEIKDGMPDTALPASLLLNMRAIYGSLKRAERSAADLILSDPMRVARSTIAEVAAICGVSQPTFVRIARRLGFDGFAQLKCALKEAETGVQQVRTPSELYHQIAPESSPSQIAESIINASIQAMQDLLCVLDHEQFDAAVGMLLEAQHMGVYGVGDAAIVAQSACHKFNRIGVECTTTNDPDMQLVQASQFGVGDLGMFISHSGRSKITVATAKRVKDMGANAVCITNYPYSPLARICDVSLNTASFMEHSGEVITKRISELVLVESLFISVLHRGGEKYERALAFSAEALVQNKL